MCNKLYDVMLQEQYRDSLEGSNNSNDDSDGIRLKEKDDAEIDIGCKVDVSHDRKRQILIVVLDYNIHHQKCFPPPGKPSMIMF